MPVPGYQTFMRPLLEVLSDGADLGIRACYQALADRFQLTQSEREELIPSGTQRLLDNRVGWAKTYLVKAGLLESPRRAVVRITVRGREALASGQQIDNKYLQEFSEFTDFVKGPADGDSQPKAASAALQTPVAQPTGTDTTPEELIEAGFDQVQKALASDLLERVKASSPAFFERLVVELLLKMGYGGSRADAGKALGKSGDQGIDGIIKEDQLGLDVIYLQAKRWENTVGRPDIQQFAGALQGQRARKGVFITTSTFTAEAKQYAAAIDTRVVLIDGAELARLMIRHSVGVATTATYELKRIDLDYFSNEE